MATELLKLIPTGLLIGHWLSSVHAYNIGLTSENQCRKCKECVDTVKHVKCSIKYSLIAGSVRWKRYGYFIVFMRPNE